MRQFKVFDRVAKIHQISPKLMNANEPVTKWVDTSIKNLVPSFIEGLKDSNLTRKWEEKICCTDYIRQGGKIKSLGYEERKDQDCLFQVVKQHSVLCSCEGRELFSF